MEFAEAEREAKQAKLALQLLMQEMDGSKDKSETTPIQQHATRLGTEIARDIQKAAL